MRRTFWYVLFTRTESGCTEGQPAFVQGGRRRRAVQRVAAIVGRGWTLAQATRVPGAIGRMYSRDDVAGGEA